MAERWRWDVHLCAVAQLALCVVGVSACASGRGARDINGLYHHPELGYQISHPGGTSSAWKSIRVDGADLAFRQTAPEPGQRPAMMILISECGRGAENPSLVARQLLIGIPDRALRHAAPMLLRGSPGWMQVFDTIEEGVAVRVKTVSIRSDGCTFDWALVAPGSFRAAEEQFDHWWSSFERPLGESAASAEFRSASGRHARAPAP